jgi:hypothetical protein
MGLDMYLTARRSFWDYEDQGENARKVLALFPELPEEVETSGTAVSVNFGYWRKANAIHNWFVENVQDGKDDCQESWLSPDNIQSLLDTVNKVLADTTLAPSLLPTTEGFFFGGTEYNEWYWRDVEYTKGLLERMLDPKMKDWHFYYQASW